MTIVKNNDNWGRSVDLSGANWTGRVPRQARINGEWAANLERQKRIPKTAYIGALLAFITFWLANFL